MSSRHAKRCEQAARKYCEVLRNIQLLGGDPELAKNVLLDVEDVAQQWFSNGAPGAIWN